MARHDTTASDPVADTSAWTDRRALLYHAFRRALLGIGSVVGLLTLYLAAPLPTRIDSGIGYIFLATFFLVVYLALLTWSLHHLRTANHPVPDGMAIIAVLGTVIILGYAYIYIVIGAQDSAAFTEELTRASAVYFTVTVLTTVGFGDITPVTDLARMVTTTQMIVGLTAISLGAKLLVQSTKLGRARAASTITMADATPSEQKR